MPKRIVVRGAEIVTLRGFDAEKAAAMIRASRERILG